MSKKEIALPWKQQLAKMAKEGKAAKEKPMTGDRVSLKGAKFSIGGKILGRELDVVIISYLFQKAWFDRPYDEKVVHPPACFAIGYSEDGLGPDKTSPLKQSDKCVDCDFNEFGSSTRGTGAGKECADHRRLAIVAYDKKGVVEGIKLLNVPPTSLGNWRGFVGEVEEEGLELIQCVTRISFEEDSTAQAPPLEFEFVKEIKTDKILKTLVGMLPEAQRMTERPFDVSKYQPVTKGAGKKTKSKKTKSKFS